jgi:hypothetical protein
MVAYRGRSTRSLDGYAAYAMNSRDPLLFTLWLLGFRSLCFGLVVMGTLAALGGVLVAVVSLLPGTRPIQGLSIGYGALFIVVGVTFAIIGVCGIRIRTRRDLDQDIEQTASDRAKLERWINR